MFTIQIQDDAGRQLKMAKNNYIYYKGADGKDTFWEWEHIAAKAEAFDPIFAQAKTLIDKAEESLPNLAMSGLR